MLRRWQQRVQRLWRPGSGRGTAALALLLLRRRGLACAAAITRSRPPSAAWCSASAATSRSNSPATAGTGRGRSRAMQKLNVANIEALDSKALMLTADQSLIEISWSVQYRISRSGAVPVSGARPAADAAPERRNAAARAGGAATHLSALLDGDARARVTAEARGRIQQIVDDYRAGINVSGVNMTDVQLPDAVLAAQRDAEQGGGGSPALDRRRRRPTPSDILPKAQSAAQQPAEPMRRCTPRRRRRTPTGKPSASRSWRRPMPGAGGHAQPLVHRHHGEHPVALAQDRHRRQERAAAT